MLLRLFLCVLLYCCLFDGLLFCLVVVGDLCLLRFGLLVILLVVYCACYGSWVVLRLVFGGLVGLLVL